jgi:hypothetical protein
MGPLQADCSRFRTRNKKAPETGAFSLYVDLAIDESLTSAPIPDRRPGVTIGEVSEPLGERDGTNDESR